MNQRRQTTWRICRESSRGLRVQIKSVKSGKGKISERLCKRLSRCCVGMHLSRKLRQVRDWIDLTRPAFHFDDGIRLCILCRRSLHAMQADEFSDYSVPCFIVLNDFPAIWDIEAARAEAFAVSVGPLAVELGVKEDGILFESFKVETFRQALQQLSC